MISAAQPNKIDAYSRFDGGISDYDKDADRNEYAFGRSVNYRDNPRKITLLPKTAKESGSVVTGLIKDGDIIDGALYTYDDNGSIYKRTTAASWSLLRTVSNSHGNGMKYYTEDDFLYYTSDKVIGRYGQIINGTPTFVDDFLGAEGGVPLNTHWLDLEASSSQYTSRADTASLSITSDIAMEMTIKPESLPAVGSSMVLMSKWNENGNIRSYKFEILAISGYFGDGSDGALTISANTTEAPIDSACTGTINTTSLSATNASFATGQQILIHQTRGTGAGTWMRNKIAGYTAGTITLDIPLNATYSSGAQVRVLRQYTNVTVDSGDTWTAKAWDGSVGGILAFLANGTVTVAGTITATGKGFRGGAATPAPNYTYQGEGTSGAGTQSGSANGNGGGGGGARCGGGSGGHGTAGQNGEIGNAGSYPGLAGNTAGNADLTTLVFGGGGGGGGSTSTSSVETRGGAGGAGGGIVFAIGTTVTVSGAITSAGQNGNNAVGSDGAGGGAGAGGAIFVKAQTATLGSALLTAAGGAVGGTPDGGANDGGAPGGDGRIHLDYYTSYTGTTSPTLNVTQDNTLVTNTTYQLRIGISSTGTNEEFLTKNATLAAGTTAHVGVSWDASDAQAEFFVDGVSIGSSTGTLTAINNNAAVFSIGCDFNSAGTARNFFDGKIDEARLWNTERTEAQMYANKETEIPVNSAGLAAYFQFDNAYTDSTANANDLTATNSPVFATDVPFASPTTRQDLDQELNTSGNTYTTPTAISEGATHRQTFVPQKDPQKSIEVLVAAVGTGNWTVTVHDSVNRVVTSKAITNANMHTGDMEFVFDSVWRPIRGASYHFHVTSTVNDGTVTTTTVSDLETVDFHTYYQFLVEDVDYHPIEQYLNFLVIANGRYIAKYGADSGYDPHRLVLPADWKVRCFVIWRGLLIIGCWKGDNIYDTDQGMLFVWDGYSPTYLDAIPIPEGGVNAMLSTRGILYIWAGYHGDMLAYRGGDYAEFVKRAPKMTGDAYIETYPKAVTMWDALLRWGLAGNSDSSDVERGVYTYGRRKASNPESLSYDYPISTGSRATTNVKIGYMIPIAKKLLIAWKDNTAYGVDVVDPAGDCFATGTIEKDIKDYGAVYKEKQALLVRADFDTLASGQQIRVKWRKNRDDNWTTGDWVTSSSTDPTVARLPINYGNNKEMEFAADIETSSGVSPSLYELTLESNLKKSERIV